MIEAFPLQWPAHYPRAAKKQDSAFKCTLAQARDGVLREIERLKGKNVVISSNIPVKKDGNLYASQKPVDGDHAVAVYFTWKNEQYVMACDRYYSIQENLRAIEKSIDAMRGLERWGASDILQRAFTGFKALPEQGHQVQTEWWVVLGLTPSATKEQITKAYKQKSKECHPDRPNGSREKWDQLTAAYEEAINLPF
jgi:hypothetical protein